MVKERAFLTGAFREVEEEAVVMGVVEEEEEEGGRAMDCPWGKGSEVEAVVAVVLGCCLLGALLPCVVSCFPVDPPPFCDDLCFTTFSSSIWVSAVP